MKRKVVTGILPTLLLITMLTTVFNIQSFKANPTVTSARVHNSYLTSFKQYNVHETTDDQAAKILSHSSYIAHGKYEELLTGRIYEGDFLHVVGEVQNVITENIEVEIIPVFYDEKGAMIKAWPVHTSIEPLRILISGQKSPFEIILLDEFASREIANYELSVESTVTTLEPGPLGFPNHRSYVSIDTFAVVGEVENIGAENIGVQKIFATFYDKEGTVIDVDWTYADIGGIEGIEILVPGEKSPFSLHGREEITEKIRSYGLCAQGATVHREPYREFRITHKAEVVWGCYTVTGEVINVGETDATFVRVVATFYDSNGRIVAYDYTYPDPNDLFTGQNGSFEVSLGGWNEELSTKVVSYALQVKCNEYFSAIPFFLEISPSKVEAGKEVKITVDVKTFGDVSGTKTVTVTLKVNGVVESTKDVTLSVGETHMVTFTVTKMEPGTYRVEIDGEEGEFIVMRAQAPFQVWILVAIAIIAVVGTALLVYFVRVKKTTEKARDIPTFQI